MPAKACALGAPCGELGMALAEAVVAAAGVRLAVEVLAGGDHQISRATELAARVLGATRSESELAGREQSLTGHSSR